jgi:predicted nucleotidyltransferase component of viral defense system
VLTRETLLAEASQLGVQPDMLEKVVRLASLLSQLRDHPYLRGRWALKGGTALNLFCLDVPRLSVDIDLNYIGAADLATMRAERPEVERAVEQACRREGLALQRVPGDHAGGKWRLRYESLLSGGGNLELDLNFLQRVPLWPLDQREARLGGCVEVTGIPVLDLHELLAGKLVALLARRAARDLFDAHGLLAHEQLEPERLRLAFVVYAAASRVDCRTMAAEQVDYEPGELKDSLLPVLRQATRAAFEADPDWPQRLVDECRARLAAVLPFTAAEVAFLDRLLDDGEIEPDRITPDSELASRIQLQPGLRWKALNVREYRQRGDASASDSGSDEG